VKQKEKGGEMKNMEELVEKNFSGIPDYSEWDWLGEIMLVVMAIFLAASFLLFIVLTIEEMIKKRKARRKIGKEVELYKRKTNWKKKWKKFKKNPFRP
jgi:hypothetical protein